MRVLQCDEADALCKTCAAESLRRSHDLLLTSRGKKGEGEGEPLGRDWGYCLGDDSPGFFAEEIMHFAIWLVGLMCHLSALVRDTLQYRLHPKQGSVLFWFRSDTVEGVYLTPICGVWSWNYSCIYYTATTLCPNLNSLSLSLTVSSFRKLHQAAVIVRNHHPAPCEWLRRIIPPQIALQAETEKFKRSPVGLAGSLQDWCIRGTLSSQPDRTLRLHRPLLHSDTLGSGTEQRHGLALPRHERHAPLLFPRTRQRQARVPCRLQPVHWPCEYRYFLKFFFFFF